MTASRPELKQLSSNEIFDFAFNRIIGTRKEYAERINYTVINPTTDKTVYGVRFVANNKSIVLLSTASDKTVASLADNNVGTTPLPDVLNKIRSLQAQNPQDIYIFPLSECGTMLLGMTTRQHFTLLAIENNECYFYDPCSDSYSPWEISGSSIYSLAPIMDFLAKAGFNLEKSNTTYLGWQSNKDGLNCGRFCATIAGRIASMYFAEKTLSSIKNDLTQLYVKPQDNELLASTLDAIIKDAAECVTDKSILESTKIVIARGQLPYPQVLKPADLNLYDAGNSLFKEYQQKGFFEAGEGGLHQFKLEADRLQKIFFIDGVACADLFTSQEKTLESMAAELGWSVERFQKIVAAHSQGPVAFLPMILDEGVAKLDEPTIKIAPPDAGDMRFDLITQAGAAVQLVCRYNRFPIKSYQVAGLICDYINGPVTVNYTLQQNAENKWGWQLTSVKTKNMDILRILSGARLPERYFTRPFSDMVTVKLSSVVAIDSSYAADHDNNSEAISKLLAEKKQLATQIQILEEEKKQLLQIIQDEKECLQKLSEDNHALAEEKKHAEQSASLALKELRRYGEANTQLKQRLDEVLAHTIAVSDKTSPRSPTSANLDSLASASKKDAQKANEGPKSSVENVKLQEIIKGLSVENEKLKEKAKQQNVLIQQLTELQAKLDVVEDNKEGLNSKMSLIARELRELTARNNQLATETTRLQEALAERSKLYHQALAVGSSAKDAFAQQLDDKQKQLDEALARVQTVSKELFMTRAEFSKFNAASATKDQKNAEMLQEMKLSVSQLESDKEQLQHYVAGVKQDNLRFNALATKPYQPVIRYAAASLITTGASVTSTLVALGVITLGLLTAVPVIGWGIAAGFLLAMTLVLATKGVQNFFANRNTVQIVPVADADSDDNNASCSVSISIAHVEEDKALSQVNTAAAQFTASKSALQLYGLLGQSSVPVGEVKEDQRNSALKSFYQ